jgi:hypothetical protein
MKTILLITLIMFFGFTHLTWSQKTVVDVKPFRPYWSFELSDESSLFSSAGLLKKRMKAAGYGGVMTGFSIFGGYYTAYYPDVFASAGVAFTIRYQRTSASGFAGMFNRLEDYSIIGLAADKTTFTGIHKINSASLLYTLATPNQRLKAGAGVSYLWFKSSQGYGSTQPEDVAGSVGLKINVTFIFVRVKPFYASFILDGTMAGSVPIGPFHVGKEIWHADDLSLSSLSYGLSVGINIK